MSPAAVVFVIFGLLIDMCVTTHNLQDVQLAAHDDIVVFWLVMAVIKALLLSAFCYFEKPHGCDAAAGEDRRNQAEGLYVKMAPTMIFLPPTLQTIR